MSPLEKPEISVLLKGAVTIESMKLYLWITLIQVYTFGIRDAVPDTLLLNYLLLVLKMLYLKGWQLQYTVAYYGSSG